MRFGQPWLCRDEVPVVSTQHTMHTLHSNMIFNMVIMLRITTLRFWHLSYFWFAALFWDCCEHRKVITLNCLKKKIKSASDFECNTEGSLKSITLQISLYSFLNMLVNSAISSTLYLILARVRFSCDRLGSFFALLTSESFVNSLSCVQHFLQQRQSMVQFDNNLVWSLAC